MKNPTHDSIPPIFKNLFPPLGTLPADGCKKCRWANTSGGYVVCGNVLSKFYGKKVASASAVNCKHKEYLK